MSRVSHTGLWTVALTGSLALHGALGMALFAMPAPEAKKPPPTEITFEALDSATLTGQAQAETAPVAVDQALAAKVASVEAVAPVPASATVKAADDVKVLTGSEAQVPAVKPADAKAIEPVTVETAEPAAEATALSSVEDAPEIAAEASPAALAATSQAAEPMTPAADASLADLSPGAADAIAPATQKTPSASVAVAQSVAPAGETPSTVSAVGDSAPAAQAEDAREAPLADDMVPASVSAPETSKASVAPTSQAASAATVAPTIVARASATQSINGASATPVQTQSAASPTGNAATVVRPSTASGAVAAVADVAPAAAGPSGNGQAATALAPVADTGGSTAAPVEPQAEPEIQIAMLPPQTAAGGTSADDTPVRLADFLKSYEGGGCMLAIPTGDDVVETFSDAPDSVRTMGREFRRQSGVPVKTQRQTVSKAQCGTLAFSRSLAQYPNYPLQLALDSRTIASGTALSGHITGLRKPTLYLFVVDDEGKAKLIEALSNQNTTTVGFRVPLTLTDGAFDSVQLLVAIASDSPLKTTATKGGVEAEAFFASLADEIRSGNKPIHYGITSFTLR